MAIVGGVIDNYRDTNRGVRERVELYCRETCVDDEEFRVTYPWLLDQFSEGFTCSESQAIFRLIFWERDVSAS